MNHNSWTSFRWRNSAAVWRATVESTRCIRFPAWTSSCAWHSPNSPTARVCATLRLVCARLGRACIIGASAARFRGILWHTPASGATGAFTPTSRKFSSARLAPCMPTIPSAWISIRRSTRLDSTTIDLCLALFPWAPFQRSKGAVKLHTLLDLQGNIPTVIEIRHDRISDVSQLDRLRLEASAFYILDRGYVHFQRLY